MTQMDINRIDHLGTRDTVLCASRAQTRFEMLDILLFPLFPLPPSLLRICVSSGGVFTVTLLTPGHFFMPYPMPFIYSPFILSSI